MRKKLISLVLVVVFCILLFPANALQDEYTVSATDRMADKLIYDESLEFQIFTPDNDTARSASLTLTYPVAGLVTVILFDEDCDLDLVEYETTDPDVATGYNRRIYTNGTGSATITIRYGDEVQTIQVVVEDEFSEALVREMIAEQTDALLSKSTDSATRDNHQMRLNIVNKGSNMVYYHWTPTQNLTGWQGNYTFYANTQYTGIPYTQYIQCDENSFASALSYADFYTSYNYGIIMPRYGNDCSGFVSICWGIARINTTQFAANYSSIGSYSVMQIGDALLTSGHIMLVIQNNEVPYVGDQSYVYVYEQTPPKARMYDYTYSQLSSLGYYPISKF